MHVLVLVLFFSTEDNILFYWMTLNNNIYCNMFKKCQISEQKCSKKRKKVNLQHHVTYF